MICIGKTKCTSEKGLLADGIDLVEVANLFVGDNQRRKQPFGKFS